MVLRDELRAQILDPPIATGDLPGLGGVLRVRPEDFAVSELPAYEPDGQPGHLMLTMRKRGLSTGQAVDAVARHLRLEPRDIGTAGRKDKDAVTEQRISVPQAAAGALESFEHDAIELGPATPHRHKLRMGHLQGNRFQIVIRDLELDASEALRRCAAKQDALQSRSIDNVYGPQRFGTDGLSLDRGLSALARGRSGRRGNMIVAAGQAGLFNLYVVQRRREGLRDVVLRGDILEKTDTGGMFESEDPEADQPRLDRGEVCLTGPIFGSRMRAPGPDTPAAALEAATLALAGIPASALEALGRAAQGTRRRLDLRPRQLQSQVEHAAVPGPSDGSKLALRVEFSLAPGSFATRVCAELQRPA